MAERFARGLRVNRDPVKAAYWYREAAINGDIDAQCIYGLMCRDGDGISQNHAEALKWLTIAAKQNDVGAQFHLAVLYRDAPGAFRSDPDAVYWFLLAASQGEVRAQKLLGDMHLFGRGRAANAPWRESDQLNGGA